MSNVFDDSTFDDNLPEVPAAVVENIASWRRIFANRRTDDVRGLLRNAASELFCTRKINKTVYPDSDPIANQAITDALAELADSVGIPPDDAQLIFAQARESPSKQSNGHATDDPRKDIPPAKSPEEFGNAPDLANETAGENPVREKGQPLQWLDMSKWDNEPRPEREWAIFNRVPLKQAGLFSGEGGAGKSIIEMMKDVAHVTAKDWLGSLPEPGPAWYIGAEDDEKEIHIRFYDIASHYGVTFKELTDGGLKVLCMLGQDATLCAAAGKSGKVEVTALYRQLFEAAADIKPKNISVDTLSRAFAGSELDRVQVYAFAMHMQALAMAANGSVTVLSHPSLSGIASGSGISGSTAWHGAFRFRQYLKGIRPDGGEQPDNDLRELEFKKNQYGPTGETIALRYQRGLFLPVAGIGTLDKLAHEAKADETFLDLLKRFAGEGRNTSHNDSSRTYAPAAFAKEAEAKKVQLRKPDFEAAMRRLFANGKIHVDTYGRPSRPYTRLAIK